jgi:hypothetical protein
MTTRARRVIWLELLVVATILAVAWYFGAWTEAGG